MMWPDVHDERMIELRGRGLPARPRIAWRSNGIFLSLLFFALTSLGVAATFGFFHLVASELAWLTAVLSIGLAEHLVRVRRFFGTGVESALWLGGLFVAIFELPGRGSSAVLLLFASAAALAGFRVRNAFFGALAAVFVIAYLVIEDHRGAAAWTGLVISLAALAALTREWRRPSTEAVWSVLVVIPPIASFFATMEGLPPWWILVYAATAVACTTVGLIARMHIPLIAGGVYVVLAAATVVAHDLLPLPREWSLVIGGAALLASSALVARSLRNRTRGVVTTPSAMTPFDDEVQILATIAAQPHGETQPPDDRGGRFGGAGATGDY